MKNQSPEEIASKVWKLLEDSKSNPTYKGLTDGQILSGMIANGTITLEELNIAFDIRKNPKKSR